jgi:hypothetical protein
MRRIHFRMIASGFRACAVAASKSDAKSFIS